MSEPQESGVEQVHVAICDCGSTWTVDPDADRNRGCLACHKALSSEHVRVYEASVGEEVTDLYEKEDRPDLVTDGGQPATDTDRGPMAYECAICGADTYETGPCHECGALPHDDGLRADGGEPQETGSERLFECPECENKATVESGYDGVDVLLGCSDGHETKTMVEVQTDGGTDSAGTEREEVVGIDLEPDYYTTPMQCDECLGHWEAEFDDPEESFSTTCPHCGTHYPEVYV